MLARIHRSHRLDDLRDYINETLCDHYQLQIDAFRMTERILHRRGKPCGMYFCLHGPRGLKFSAIWETDRNCILFYGPNGERFQKTQLLEAPNLEPLEAHNLQGAAA